MVRLGGGVSSTKDPAQGIKKILLPERKTVLTEVASEEKKECKGG